MAGSYMHIVADDGKLLAPKRLCSMLECMSGDVYEACEEMYGMIWWFADALDGEFGIGDGTERARFVEEARQNYKLGLELSPGVIGTDRERGIGKGR